MRRLAPLLPSDTRGKPRVDDRRVISGIVHVLRSGGRWVDAPAVYGPRKTLYNRFVRWAAKGVWQRVFRALAASGGPASRAPARQQPRQGPSQRRGWKRGERAQAIGRSRGGRTTKIHAAANQAGKPIAVHLSGGNAADLRGGEALIEAVFEGALVIADRAFAADRPPTRSRSPRRGAAHPAKANRRQKSCFSPALSRSRNAIERMACRLKDLRRIATRDDRLAAIRDRRSTEGHIAATVAFWL